MSSNSRKQKEKSNYPFTFNVIPETLESPFKELFPSYPESLVQSEPGNFVYHPLYSQNADEFYNFTIMKDDVWIRTFPKSGNNTIILLNYPVRVLYPLNDKKKRHGLPSWLGSLWTTATLKRPIKFL